LLPRLLASSPTFPSSFTVLETLASLLSPLDEVTLASFAVFELAVAAGWLLCLLIERWRR
jgi:hypothetical protein